MSFVFKDDAKQRSGHKLLLESNIYSKDTEMINHELDYRDIVIVEKRFFKQATL